MNKKKTITSSEAVEDDEDLTVQEIAFVQNIINGMSNIDSFRAAYKGTPKEKWTYNSVATEGTKYLKKQKIQNKLIQLRKEYEKNYFMSLEFKRAELRVICEDNDNSLKDRLAAMKLDAQLGQHLQQKIEIAGGLEVQHIINPAILDAMEQLFN
jgi:hypothetical protein